MEPNPPLETNFAAIVVAVIYDPAKKKILIGKRENDPNLPNLSWCFPGGRLNPGEEIDKKLKKQVKDKTGYDIKNLGIIFSNINNEKEDLLQIFFLTEVFTGKEKPAGGLTELKWVDPEELEEYFGKPFNSRLKEYLINLK